MISPHPKVLAIIPARGGSKGLPRKNILDLCGKPLIAYSIEAALKTSFVDRVVVSTEDGEIAEISKHYGAEVPFLRPEEMATDRASIAEAVHYTINRLRLEGYVADAFITLYPTHPFRNPRLLNFLVDKTLSQYTFVYTHKMITYDNLTLFRKDGNGGFCHLLPYETKKSTCDNRSYFRNYGTFLGVNYANYGCTFKPYLHVIRDEIVLIDIDTLADFYLAESVIKEKLFDFDLI